MSTNSPPGWEPDPRSVGNHWTSMFAQPRGAAPALPEADAVGETSDHDPAEYRPWIVQRGRARPAMMLELRRFEARSGLWQGWMMSYPSLHAVEYLGERMLILDFGARKFIIEGNGLGELARQLQHGLVTSVLEYSEKVWPSAGAGSHISAIRLKAMAPDMAGP